MTSNIPINDIADLLSSINLGNENINNTENCNLSHNLMSKYCENENSKSDSKSKENTTTDFDIFEVKMSPLTLNIDPLKYLNRLPEFSGDSRDLQNFVSLIDKVHPTLLRYDTLGQSIFSDVIKSKLKGKAREVIEINNHVTCWLEIKEILINNFGETISMEELFDHLRGVTFKTNSVNFYNEIKVALRKLNVKTALTLGENAQLSESTITNNKNSALTIFKNKIPEPMRSILYCRNPETLEAAMDILHESGYAYHTVFPNKPINPTPRNNGRNINYSNRNTFNNDFNLNNYGKNDNSNSSNNSNVNRNKNKVNRGSDNKNFPRGNHNFMQPNRNRYDNTTDYRYQRPNSYSRDLNSTQSFNRNMYNNNFPQNEPQRPIGNPFKNTYRENPNNIQQNQNLPPPEPMDVNTSEIIHTQSLNFPLPASTTNYPMS